MDGVWVNTNQDLPYDYEDFSLDLDGLHAKYNPTGDGGEHSYYTRAGWREAVEQDATLAGYWDWVLGMIAQDDEDYP